MSSVAGVSPETIFRMLSKRRSLSPGLMRSGEYSEPLAGRLHGYQPRFFTNMGYCSDSEGRFRFHHPLEHPAVQAGFGLQLVIHPIWWCAGEEDGPLAKLERFLSERAQTVADEMAANCRPYAEARTNG